MSFLDELIIMWLFLFSNESFREETPVHFEERFQGRNQNFVKGVAKWRSGGLPSPARSRGRNPVGVWKRSPQKSKILVEN